MNLTTNEMFNYKRYNYLKNGRGKYHNPYSRGVIYNLAEFFLCVQPIELDEAQCLELLEWTCSMKLLWVTEVMLPILWTLSKSNSNGNGVFWQVIVNWTANLICISVALLSFITYLFRFLQILCVRYWVCKMPRHKAKKIFKPLTTSRYQFETDFWSESE